MIAAASTTPARGCLQCKWKDLLTRTRKSFDGFCSLNKASLIDYFHGIVQLVHVQELNSWTFSSFLVLRLLLLLLLLLHDDLDFGLIIDFFRLLFVRRNTPKTVFDGLGHK